MQAIKNHKRELVDSIIKLLPAVSPSLINAKTFWMSETELKELVTMIHDGDRNEFYEMINS
ncbi:hypothetical protein [Lactiplantibacillus plantarum]|uniref:hypothetical protein n=1 Tax=Lactiplantibacillus plantarum TaxID=1590 RepID=UPI0007178312|nr:hypothetical protein [Lactiplantibacillus plantarum]AVE82318.1 hypothetical protein C4O30_04640 [Lactiplantibacillus plantarum]KRU19096.1 hypothetical protein ASU25_13375 [Lactiplantibacillus plantarum]MCT3206257.1 hypothetical protein [Lactiplantibacillus plantarum]MCT3219825.1 hypothetical protein [Lactiplantibacillus plantarum]MCT3265264.1 hypothetical protein [Lactiplantibacillus plantarum]